MNDTRALACMARRSVAKSPLRSLLIVALIALLVGTGTAAATLIRTDTSTAEDRVDGLFGQADLVVTLPVSAHEFANRPYALASEHFPEAVGPVPIAFQCDGPFEECDDEPFGGAATEVVDAFEDWQAEFDGTATAMVLAEALGVPRADVMHERLGWSGRQAGRVQSPFATYNAVDLVTDLDPQHPLAQRSVRIVEGRAVESATEIVLTEPVLSGRDLSIGSTVALPGAGDLTIVGSARLAGASSWMALVDPALLESVDVAVSARRFRIKLADDSPAAISQIMPTIEAIVGSPVSGRTSDHVFQPDLAGDWSAVADRYGFGPDDDLDTLQIWTTMLTVIVGLQIALVAAATFAVAVRRRAREFGQLVAIGADQRHVRRLIMIEAGFLGALGAALGIVAGLAFAWYFARQGWLVQPSRVENDVRWNVLDWVGPAIVGIGAALAAAWWPTRKLASASADASGLLTTPPARPERYQPKLGLVAVIVGVIGFGLVNNWALNSGSGVSALPVAMLVMIFVVATFAGLLLLVGAVLSFFGRRADRLPLLPRLVVRNSDRTRGRSWMVVGAFVVTMAIPVLVGASTKAYPDSWGRTVSDQTRFAMVSQSFLQLEYPSSATQSERPEVAEVRAGLQSLNESFANQADQAVAIAAQARLEILRGVDSTATGRDQGSFVSYAGDGVAIATPELLEVLQIPDAIARKLDMSTVLVLGDRSNEEVEMALLVRPELSVQPQLLPVQGVSFERDGRGSFVPGALVSRELAESLNVPVVFGGTTFRTVEPLRDNEEAALREIADELWRDEFTEGFANENLAASLAYNVWLDFPWTSSGPTPWVGRLIALAIAAALAAVVALITSALSAVELDREMEAMVANGAPPRTRRWMLGLQTLYHLLVAAALAIPTALLLFWTVTSADTGGPQGITIDWPSVAMAGLAIPLVVAGLIALLFRNGKPAVTRRLA